MRTGSRAALAALALSIALSSACGAPATRGSVARAAAPNDHDPLEPVNRKVFWFNDRVDAWVLEPAAKGWDRVASKRVQRSVANFFANLRFPIVTANDLLQGKVKDGASDVARFALNTTFGAAGFFDPAASWGLPPHVEDFGQTLGRWGVPPGPYLVLPLLGPSSPRDTVGLAADSVTAVTSFYVNFYIQAGARTADVVNYRARVLEQVEESKRSSLDYYSFIRNAYVQRRRALIQDSTAVGESDQDSLYHPDLDEEE